MYILPERIKVSGFAISLLSQPKWFNMVECIFHDKTILYNFFWYLPFQNHITIIILDLMIEIEGKWSDYKRPYRT